MFMRHQVQRERQLRLNAVLTLALSFTFVFATMIVAFTLPAAASAMPAATADAARLATMLVAPARFASGIDTDHVLALVAMSTGLVVMTAALVAFCRNLIRTGNDKR